MTLFQRGSFTLHSGSKSQWKIDCDTLTDADWETLALMLAERLPPFGEVIGIPQGGLKLAEELRKYRMNYAPLLIVDDVLTTGMSMESERLKYTGGVHGAVVFARGICPDWITPLFQMPIEPKLSQQNESRLLTKEELMAINNACPPDAKYGDVFRAIAKAQRELTWPIAFEEGRQKEIREVVEDLMGVAIHSNPGTRRARFSYALNKWQAKLKSWNI